MGILKTVAMLLLALIVPACQAAAPDAPTLADVLSVPEVGHPGLSPDGERVFYTVKVPDWENNRYDTEIFVVKRGETAIALTDNAEGSSTDPKWSPDGRFIAFMADRGDGTQIYRTSVTDQAGGGAEGREVQQITAWPGGLLSFEWAPDGKHLALLMVDWPDPAIAERAAQYGEFEILDESPLTASLWLLDIEKAIAAGGAGPGPGNGLRRLTSGSEFSVSVFSVDGFRLSYSFSPDGKTIVFSHGQNMMVMGSIHSNISLVDVETGVVIHLITSESWDETPLFSPDGRQVLFTRTVIDDWLADKQLVLVPAGGGEARAIDIDHGSARDTQPMLLDWTEAGIAAFFQNGTTQQAHSIDPLSGEDAQRVSRVTEHTTAWPVHKAELMHWTTPDGIDIEGILYSPAGLAAGAPAPLILVLHGGPRAADNMRLIRDQEYPVSQWLAQGARVLMPNYRGSTAYGVAFRKLTLKNIGLAESIDVISAVDEMIAAGQVADNRVGIAGHSWGGYLSAFLSTSTDRFCVASVGSGITDNRINYILSMAGVAKEGYLGSYPWEEPELWDRTSPIHYLSRASTPTLIQHGDGDTVVPPENARELYQGLKDMGVPARAVIFKNTGHNISRPREKLAWMQQNLDWFTPYLWASSCADRAMN